MRITTARASASLLLLVALTATACSSGSGDADSSSADGGGAAPAARSDTELRDGAAGVASAEEDVSGTDGAADSAGTGDTGGKAGTTGTDSAAGIVRAVIRTGDVAFEADDVAHAQFEVRKVVDHYAGEVTEEQTESDHDDGLAAFSHLVLRIPSEHFADAVSDLKELGERPSVTTNAKDVTTKLIDVQARVRAQKRSIARITVLFKRAESIRDVMAIEAQLSQRQADLDALERQRAYLAGQSSMSTITVSIDRTATKTITKTDDDAGFLSGLDAGWGALTTFGVGTATVAGALLPWLALLGLLGVPTLLLVRAARRRTPSRPAPAQPSE